MEKISQNKANAAWSLKGLLIGNGWISPVDQYPSYLQFAVEKGLVKKGSEMEKDLQANQRICDARLARESGLVDYNECEEILSKILQLTKKGTGDDACYNMYDVRLKDSYPSCGMNWPPDLKSVTPYLRRPEVTRALHVNSQKTTGWQECSGVVGAAFKSSKTGKPSIELLPGLIKEVPILMFSGAEDLICNHLGTEKLISNMEWNGGKGFEVTPGNWAPRRDWTFEGKPAGFWQEARNLTYVLFYNSSHMVPFDYPRRTRDMLDRFMGVDISSIGGEPTDSRIDGEKGPQTTVGGGTNKTHANEEETKHKLNEAKWAAYQRSGEIVLVIVIIAAAAWGYFIWRERRAGALYRALRGNESAGHSTTRLEDLRRKHDDGDIEAAAFDERELDNLHVHTPTTAASKYAIGDDDDSDEESDEEDVKEKHKPKEGQNGSSSR